MSAFELLNAWGTAWADLMVRALVDASVLLAVVLAVWLPLRRRMSAQLAHGLFCLVLLKLIVPVPVTRPAWLPALSVRQAAERVASWARQVEPAPQAEAVAASLPEPPAPVILPTTGDLGSNLADPAALPLPAAAGPGVPSGDEIEGVSGGAISAIPATEARVRLSTPAFLMIAWALFATLLLARFLRALLSTRRLIRESLLLDPGSLPIDVEALRRAAGIRLTVRWAISPKLHSPAVGGLLRPTVVIPPDLDEGLTPKQLTWVLLHELAHVRRGDLWVTVVQRVVQAVFFFHPAVHVANWIIDQLREYACDDAALAACKASRHDCGEGFLTVVGRTVERAPTASPALGLFESRMLIRRRLLRILDKRRKVHGRLSPGAAVGLLAVGLVVVPYGRTRDVSAHTHTPVGGLSALAAPAEADEPVNYRAGVVWRRNASQEDGPREASPSEARDAVLAVAYSPDGKTLASASGAAVLLREFGSEPVVARLSGHRDLVACLAFSPDGRTIATGGYDRTVRLWDLATRRETGRFEGHTNWVFAVAFSPDGKRLASAGHDKTVRVWDVAAGREAYRLDGHAASVRAVAFSPDGSSLASGGADRSVILWDLVTRSPRAHLEGHRGTVRALAFAPVGSTLATAAEDGETRLWDVASARGRAVLTGHTDMVACLAFSPQGGTLATGSHDTTVRLWDVRAGRERAALQVHADVSALAFAPGARQLATGGFDGAVRLWEPIAPLFSPAACLGYPGEPRSVAFAQDGRSLIAAGEAGVARWDAATGSALGKVETGGATALAVSRDGASYATSGPDGKIRLIEAASGKVLATLEGHGDVRTLAYSPSGALLASGGKDGVLRVWDVKQRRLAVSFPALPAAVTCVRFSPDGRTLAAATGEGPAKSAGTVALWTVAGWKSRGTLRGHTLGVESVAFSPDGRTIATAGTDGLIRLWDAKTLAARNSLKYDACLSVAFSPDGRTLASAHRAPAPRRADVVLWDAETGRQVGLLKGGRCGAVLEVAFSPDGRSLASTGTDRTVKLWNLTTGRRRARETLKGELDVVRSIAYSPDGKTLAVADGNGNAAGTVTLWDVATRRVKAVLEGHQLCVLTVLFSPDGTTLVTGGADRTVRIWNVATGEPKYVISLDGPAKLAFSPDGKLLASAGEDEAVALWEVETGEEVGRLRGFRGLAWSVAFSPDGKLLAAAGGDFEGKPRGEVKVWDVAERSVVATLEGHECGVLALAFSPDGATLATGGRDQTVRLWDVASGQSKLTLGGLPDWVQSLAFSPNGRLLAWSGRGDGLVALHDVKTGAEVDRLVGHGGAVLGLAFAPDGSSVATGGVDRTIKLWDVPAAGPPVTAKR
jgi:WD40 repeat protein/beta-lactamase regulating signal transducer with metallopeptidase domain